MDAKHYACRMKILVLGESESAGTQSGGVSWATLFRDRMADELDSPVEYVHTTFIATGERAASIALERVKEHEPDIVLMPVGGYVFNTRFVWLRVQRLFGRRAGRWFRTAEVKVDAATYERGSVRGRLNDLARRLTHRLIGGEPITTRQESAAVFAETFQQLAQVENVQVVAVGYPRTRTLFDDPKDRREAELYLGAVRDSAEQRHFLFVDSDLAFRDHPDPHGTLQADDLHGTFEYHDAMAEHLATQFRAHVGTATKQ